MDWDKFADVTLMAVEETHRTDHKGIGHCMAVDLAEKMLVYARCVAPKEVHERIAASVRVYGPQEQPA
jgi:hypothetical protein